MHAQEASENIFLVPTETDLMQTAYANNKSKVAL